ncbi:major facilitator superfamily domain-containing protein [Kockovaella imperatae]|uniref:Major facilitator superfamily domain-containing protein n=1 Tax=Kockovaella imperatae TaxID=4999 RepID=A0A1Y1UCC2_9TREE|nr:major facilitator superfamily domain-containing protein [Kockovaella imperatae]ORX35698.1 major facilitator superfamily domain-containing protein [Kockovaella imperatae]
MTGTEEIESPVAGPSMSLRRFQDPPTASHMSSASSLGPSISRIISTGITYDPASTCDSGAVSASSDPSLAGRRRKPDSSRIRPAGTTSAPASPPISVDSERGGVVTTPQPIMELDQDEKHEENEHLPAQAVDIEHAPCEDDPREWSYMKKHFVLIMITFAFLGPLIAASIYNPVIEQIKEDLHASNVEIGLSLSLYILCQGWFPVMWASIAEIIGRKPVYLSSYFLYTIATTVASRSPNMPTLVAMRAVMAIGSAAVTCLGAGTLADVFEVHERGKKLGFFYGVSLVGPAIGPFLGGLLGHAFGWRSTLYFLAAYAAVVDCLFFFFPDTWRKERSRIYQKAVRNASKRKMHQDEKAQRRATQLDISLSATEKPPSDGDTPRNYDLPEPGSRGQVVVCDERSQDHGSGQAGEKAPVAQHCTETTTFRPTLRDVNPLPSMWTIAKMPTNLLMIGCSGLMFGAQYCIPYTASLTLAKYPYDYNSFKIGLVVLAFGGGSLVGSVIGGRLSDRALAISRRVNKGVNIPEFRLRSTIPFMPFMVGSFLAYGWMAEQHVDIAGIVVILFCTGIFLMLVYSSAFAYLVDANPGQSSSAISFNSLVRGSVGCVLSQIAIPIQTAIGDGGLYTLIAGLLMFTSAGIILIMCKGAKWRDPVHRFHWPWSKWEAEEQDDGPSSRPSMESAASRLGQAQ